jgi:hypothetical protein
VCFSGFWLAVMSSLICVRGAFFLDAGSGCGMAGGHLCGVGVAGSGIHGWQRARQPPPGRKEASFATDYSSPPTKQGQARRPTGKLSVSQSWFPWSMVRNGRCGCVLFSPCLFCGEQKRTAPPDEEKHAAPSTPSQCKRQNVIFSCIVAVRGVWSGDRSHWGVCCPACTCDYKRRCCTIRDKKRRRRNNRTVQASLNGSPERKEQEMWSFFLRYSTWKRF